MPTTQFDSTAPIRTGIIGFGLSGRVFHAPFVATNPAFRLDLIATGNPDRAAEVHIALAKLPEEDRTALVLRYWENRSLREVGTAFGIGEDAAQKRVSRALDRLRNRLGAGTGALGVTALAQCLTLAPEAQAAVPAWISTVVGTSLDPALTSTPGSLKFAGTFKTGMLGAGLAAGVCWAVFIPEINRLKQDLASVRADATPSTAALVSTPPLSSAKPEQITVSNPALEQRIRQLEARLESKTAREQMVVANLKRARDRADRDRQTFSADDLTDLESAYQLAKQEADPARHAAALRPLLEKFGSSNRAGCAVLRLARLTTGPDRERWLQEAIVNHSDTYYLDGTSVGAMARLQLAAEWAHAGRQPGAAQLRQEIEDLFPDATDHDGLPVLESLRGSTRPD